MNARVHAGTHVPRALPRLCKTGRIHGRAISRFSSRDSPADRSIGRPPSLSLSFSLSLSLISRCFTYHECAKSSEIKRVSRFSDTLIGLKIARTDRSRSARYKSADLDPANPTARSALIIDPSIRGTEPKSERSRRGREGASHATGERNGDLHVSDLGLCTSRWD